MSQSGILDIQNSGPTIPTQFDTDDGNSAVPIANVLEIFGNTVSNATYAKPLETTGSGNTVTINIQTASAITGAPGDKNDAGICSFDDTMFTVDANGYVQLAGGSVGLDSLTGDDGNVVTADGAGNIDIQGTTVANGTYVKPLYITGTPASNLITPNIQIAAALPVNPADYNDAGIASFDSAAFTISSTGYVQLLGGGAPTVQYTLDDTNTVVPNASGNVNVYGQDTPNTSGLETYRLSGSEIGVRMASPFTLEDFTFSNSTAGAARVLTVSQSDNTNTSSNAELLLQTGGTSGGDPFIRWNIPSGQDYSMGIDNTDSDKLKITDDADPSTGNALFTITPTGTTIYPFLAVDNIKIDGNTIITTDTNGNLNLTPDGGGIISHSKARVGGNVGIQNYNTDNTNASSDAYLQLLTGGSSGGDPYLSVGIATTQSFCYGVDNSASDSLKINTAVGSLVTPSSGTNLWTMTTAGEKTMPLQPAFNAYLGTTDSNALGGGAGTKYLGDTDTFNALTERFDQNSDFTTGASGGAYFTAPVTGRYQFNFFVLFQDFNNTGGIQANLETSNENYTYGNINTTSTGTGNYALSFSVITDMDAADVAKISYSSSTTTQIIDVYGDATTPRTVWSGFLVC